MNAIFTGQLNWATTGLIILGVVIALTLIIFCEPVREAFFTFVLFLFSLIIGVMMCLSITMWYFILTKGWDGYFQLPFAFNFSNTPAFLNIPEGVVTTILLILLPLYLFSFIVYLIVKILSLIFHFDAHDEVFFAGWLYVATGTVTVFLVVTIIGLFFIFAGLSYRDD